MTTKNIVIKNKIINHLTFNGEKKTSEKILIKATKELQKNSKKQSKNLIKVAIISSIPTLKIFKLTNKKVKKKKRKIKEIPVFIKNKYSRNSFSIKFILNNIKNKKSKVFYKSLEQEIIYSSKFKSLPIQQKDTIQKQALKNKRFFKYYKWN